MDRASGRWRRKRTLFGGGALVVAAGVAVAVTTAVGGADAQPLQPLHAEGLHTSTPIKHVVVIFGENVSYDHYFGTYPNAANTDGTKFVAANGTPKADGLTPQLLKDNPNAYDPKRLSPSQALTCDQNHSYGAEQKAFDGGRMDKFVENTETDKCTGQPILFGEPGLVMDYYDGNTVTGLWNYAQNYAMSDNSYNTVFGPSTPGAINLISGQTGGGVPVDPVTHDEVKDSSVVVSPDARGVGTVIGDPDPAFDDCSDKNHTASTNLLAMHGQNVGDLLNQQGVTWGWFQGGFRPTGSANGYAVCGQTHNNVGGIPVTDYSPHHQPFQYYQSTANEKHLPPTSVAAIGQTDQANHQYDITDFDAALQAGNMPAVSFLKAPAYQDAHAANSDPLDEQQFVVSEIDKIQHSKDWDSTAIVLAYDDSDGWYDHADSKIVNGSQDATQDSAVCTGEKTQLGATADRCGYGPRLPLLVISPFSKTNFVDHTRTDQTSVLQFIEDNWSAGRIGGSSFDSRAGGLWNMLDFHGRPAPAVQLDPKTGAVVNDGHGHH
ncbi:alkaline phosphatase family protein [Amycolatopsis acidiphila]|uniref:Alkaline phosphatase family protein n=1 Tax=Amycolatopsis acidiphila TaxID=715473 RepID=A0A557ZRI2_9PSEU|nr:alkaline phosphatase family protein [Amycolatopsis acidiphila]TVT14592.1 alkaline phosphatase family protein [Amycolatopsis acidiphila]UIJ62839.1 alkaline phosphatase family protein [Amycolatopsis acidiphila]GHG64540.1 phospholipase C [Amycolatopsis acidiphila]